MNFSPQDLALKPLPSTAGQGRALWGLLIQGLELKPLTMQWFVWCCKVIFGWICCYMFLKTFSKPSPVYVRARLIIDSRRNSDLLPPVLVLH